jgi:hypothetical protein
MNQWKYRASHFPFCPMIYSLPLCPGHWHLQIIFLTLFLLISVRFSEQGISGMWKWKAREKEVEKSRVNPWGSHWRLQHRIKFQLCPEATPSSTSQVPQVGPRVWLAAGSQLLSVLMALGVQVHHFSQSYLPCGTVPSFTLSQLFLHLYDKFHVLPHLY